MKRIMPLMAVVALMAVMLAVSVTPAVARPLHQYSCTQPGGAIIITFPTEKSYFESVGYDCVKLPRDQWF